MAEIIVGPGGRPQCSGCRETFYFLHYMLDSRAAYHWDSPFLSQRIKAGERGTSGPEVEEFSRQHAACAEPRREVSPSGIPIVDRRRTGGLVGT